jgi:hypothetical protein
VSGKVTYKGKTLVWGTVRFEGSDKAIKQENLNSDGTYTVRGVATGQAKAAVAASTRKVPENLSHPSSFLESSEIA